MKKATQPQTVGERMKFARKDAGLTLMQLAVKIGTSSPSYLSKLETSANLPGTEILNAVSKATGYSVDWLLNGPKAKEPKS
jgi:transcriptional regulator with XRE-family HTH domain